MYDWKLFKFKSNSNPYIAKTEKEYKAIMKKYKGKITKYNGNIYIVDDREAKTYR